MGALRSAYKYLCQPGRLAVAQHSCAVLEFIVIESGSAWSVCKATPRDNFIKKKNKIIKKKNNMPIR